MQNESIKHDTEYCITHSARQHEGYEKRPITALEANKDVQRQTRVQRQNRSWSSTGTPP